MIWEGAVIASLLLKIPLKDFEVIKTQCLIPLCGYSFIVPVFLLLLDLLRDPGFLGSCVVSSFPSAENCALFLWVFIRTGSSELCRACLTCRYWFWRVSYTSLLHLHLCSPACTAESHCQRSRTREGELDLNSWRVLGGQWTHYPAIFRRHPITGVRAVFVQHCTSPSRHPDACFITSISPAYWW